MSSSDDPRIQTLTDAADVGNLRNAFVVLISMPITAFFVAGADFIEAAGNLFILPLEALAEGVYQFVFSILGGAADIMDAGAFETVQSLVQGPFGPASFAVAMGAVLAAAYVFSWYIDKRETGDLVPFMPDFPLVGDEDDD